jgi:nitrate/nitrite-specific signal transduction histidine kinase
MRMKWWNSLRVKIIAWSFVPTLIILSAVAWFTFYSYQKGLGDLAIKQDQEVIQEILTKALDAINSRVTPIILPIYLDPDILHTGPLEVRADNILAHIQGKEIFDGGIYFLDGQGLVFKTIPGQPELIGQDWSDDQAYRFLYEHNNSTFPTDIFTLGSSGNQVVCTTMAMIGAQAQTEGLVYLCYAINSLPGTTFNTILSTADLGQDVFILDSKHQVIYSPDLAEIGKDLSAEPYLQELLKTESLSGRFKIGSEDILASYVPMLDVPEYSVWGLLKVQSWSEIMQPTLAYRQLLIVLLALGVIVPVLVTAYGVRHITGPIQKLIQASQSVTAGQFKQSIEVQTGDEIETLANQFNQMSVKLDESYALLEKKVADRTHELATLNAIAAHVSSSLNLNEIMADALERIMELTGMEHGIAYRIAVTKDGTAKPATGAEDAYLRVMAVRGLPTSFADLGDKLPLSQSAAGVAGTRGEPVIWTLAELPTDSTLKERLLTLGVTQVIAIPLMAKGRLVGSLNLSTNQSRTFPMEQIALLNAIGQQIGVAVENAYLYEQAQQTAIEAERSRLARELHDAVTQTLFSANLIADVIPRIWKRNPEDGMQNLEELRQLTRGALAEMRTLLLEMRPESLQRADLKSLLTQLADAFIGRVRVPVSLDIQGDCTLTHEVKLVFYRVAQEALNNIAKHSGARQVDLHLECHTGQLRMLIKDDGLGFDPALISAEHLGIAIMRERSNSIGASIEIESQVGQGTTVNLEWRSNGEGKSHE